MIGRALLIALIGTVFLVFLFPYILGPFAPNGTETLVLVALLWVGVWAFSRRRSKHRTSGSQEA
jgi:hypothetical protein